MRRLGNILVIAGLALAIYAAAVAFWRDPVTDLYNRWQQHQLASELDAVLQNTEGVSEGKTALAGDGEAKRGKRAVSQARNAARDFQATLQLGQPLGRIRIEKLGVNDVFVHGTRWGPDLSRGPGHYEQTSLPGIGKTIAIAGHRTTFGAPFRHIDDLRQGDVIVLEMPYGTFRYGVFDHEIVASNDWSIIRERRFETLVLSACHPLYSAKQRWIVYARPV